MKLRPTFVPLSVLLLAAPSFAGHWFVDAALGNDANDGLSAATAVRTITHALTLPPDPATEVEVIHVAPGVYDAAGGEQFPLRMRDKLQLVGDAGPDVTVVDGAGASVALVRFHASSQQNALPTGPGTRVERLTLRRAGNGVRVDGFWQIAVAELHDLAIADMNEEGVRIHAGSTFPSVTLVEIEDVRIARAGVGLYVGASNGFAAVRALDLALEDSAGDGVTLFTGSDGGIDAAFRRARIVGSGAHGLRRVFSGASDDTRVEFEDGLVARNGGDGIHVDPLLQTAGVLDATFSGSTIADNGGIGIDATKPDLAAIAQMRIRLARCIVDGHADDLRENPLSPSFELVETSCIGDGDFSGSNGTIAADPAFRDRASGDYRLRFGSACIDVAPPVPSAVDLGGFARDADGDLDRVRESDMGAYEMHPLGTRGRPSIGTVVWFELSGPAGGTGELFAARGAPLAPFATPFGESQLDPATTFSLGSGPVARFPPSARPFAIPADPALVGRSFTFQALSGTAGLPAWTNALVLTILP